MFTSTNSTHKTLVFGFRSLALCALVAALPSTAAASHIGVFTNNATGHSYEFVADSGGSWTTAEANAQLRSFGGQTGYLAVITSAAEEAFLVQTFAGTLSGSLVVDGHAHVWVGATDAWNGGASEGDWRWVTGSISGENGDSASQFWSGAANGNAVGGAHTNWLTNEPNAGSAQDYMEWNNALTGTTVHSIWVDVQVSSSAMQGYFVEYDAVPEPSTWALIVLGGAFAAFTTRRRRNALASLRLATVSSGCTSVNDNASVNSSTKTADLLNC